VFEVASTPTPASAPVVIVPAPTLGTSYLSICSRHLPPSLTLCCIIVLSVPLGRADLTGCPEIFSSAEPIKDRKSIFVAHYARCTTLFQVKQCIAKLKTDRKIAAATHNITAYRLKNGQADRDDDGETGAGDKLFALLQRRSLTDVFVMVGGDAPLFPHALPTILCCCCVALTFSAAACVRSARAGTAASIWGRIGSGTFRTASKTCSTLAPNTAHSPLPNLRNKIYEPHFFFILTPLFYQTSFFHLILCFSALSFFTPLFQA
jgi:hypothetical protein